MTTAPKGSLRLERICSQILHEISQYIITKLDDNRLKAAQLTRAEISKDLSHAKIYFTVADADTDIKKMAICLNNASNIFRHHLAATLNLRVTPQVKFYYDENAAKKNHLLGLLAKL
jgi:ribosome-binding factor A